MKKADHSEFSAEHRNEKVRAVLAESLTPVGPSEIGRRIGEPWCCGSGYGYSAPITPVCRRIGAINTKGKYSLSATGEKP